LKNTNLGTMNNILGTMNNIIRVCCHADEELDDMAILRACLVLVQDPDDENWVYGSCIKIQGGNTLGDYHVIMKYKNSLDDGDIHKWDIAVGDWLGHNCAEAELIETASHLDGFNAANASAKLAAVHEIWMRFVRCGIDENPDYEDSYLCPKNALPNAEDVDGTLWYAEDNFDQNDKMVGIDIESVSEKVPGNIHFY
jgi:hypothetical protein